ncbi:MAG: TAXI family TRAP transporter solute-binding subunit [Planctomycetota bacterium]
MESPPSAPTSAPGPAPARDGAEPQPVPAWLMVTGVLLVVGLLTAGIASVDLSPSLRHLDVTLLTGAEEGHYHHVGQRLARLAEDQGGVVRVVATAGTLENVERLVTHARSPTVQFALVQDGLAWTAEQRQTLELVARLPSGETVFFLGKDVARFQRLADLRGKAIGIGPAGSGTAQLARQVLSGPGFDALGLRLENHPLKEQLELLEQGKLELGVVVIAEDAALIADAVCARGLSIASFPEVRALARRLPFLRAGQIVAGQLDPVRLLPASDREVLQVDTLVCGDGSARRADTVALLSLLEDAYPGLMRHDQSQRAGGLRRSKVAEDYFERGGPDLLDRYLPRLANWVPLSNLIHIVMAVSILFNLMGAGNRFALWRIDAGRVALEARWTALFGAKSTPDELGRRDPEELRAGLAEAAALADELQVLKERCRKLSVSVLVPMGQELAYRYQESLINQRLAALRHLLARAAAA